ncbi:uncharacterized protein K02A2.6-like [Episyrphus balteatus]|uniref:uncharacterized protein K02A2.6-like n=1 Tax=Episyrphus balteatus TaxID=286459 RepID=UPI00248547B2|nr:uncharacterized protein K02A2.6-like [Episyrphus balteatus]
MVRLEVIKFVDEPTEWCAPLVIVPKADGDIRLCVDLHRLNECVEREVHPMPSADHTLAQLSGAKFFTKLDTKNGFWQVKLSPQSQLMTTFLTPFGRYCFLRLPFGISSAPEIFQKQIQRIIEGIPGVLCQTDDILVYGSTIESHDDNVRKVLRRLESKGVTLNGAKCQVGITSVTFLGHRIDDTGIHPGKSKVEAIDGFSTPSNVTELKRFLGLVNYLGKFVPDLATICHPLNELLRNNVSFTWGVSQNNAFLNLKKILITEPVLKMFDPSHKTIISADASSFGLGAVLRQEDSDGFLKPVAYASRTLTETEKGYAQIEKEALAITWATCEKFRDYVTGMSFFIETDHKPLVPIFTSKNLDELTPRLQRFRMRMLQFLFKIFYTPGKDLIAADALSRSPVVSSNQSQESEEDLSTFVKAIISVIPATKTKIDEIKTAQQNDAILNEVKNYVQNGWPIKQKTSPEARQFFNDRYSLAINDGMLMYANRLVIPHKMRNEMLTRIHEGHLGINKCRARARQSVWWPGCAAQVEHVVKGCEVCIQHTTPRHEPLIPTETPKNPWQMVGADIFFCQSKTFLVVSDYFSRFPEIALLENQSAKCIISKLKSIFSRHGIPEIVRTDNGPQFKQLEMSEFRNFAREWGFTHITSSPRFPQSNGFIESAVKTVKLLMKKNEDPYLALLEYRATPTANGYSPAELLMNRRLRTTLPLASEQLRPKLINYDELQLKEQALKRNQAKNFDQRRGVHKRQEFLPDDIVWVRDLHVWGRIVNKANLPRSYYVETERDLPKTQNDVHIPEPTADLQSTPVSTTSEEPKGGEESTRNSDVETHPNYLTTTRYAPSSARYCHPIKLLFAKETTDLIKREVDQVVEQINALPAVEIHEGEIDVAVKSIFLLSMVDGKVCTALSPVTSSSQSYYICGAKPSEMNNRRSISTKIENPLAMSFGLSPLHSWIRFMECILHIAYRLEVKVWQVKDQQHKENFKARKKKHSRSI